MAKIDLKFAKMSKAAAETMRETNANVKKKAETKKANTKTSKK